MGVCDGVECLKFVLMVIFGVRYLRALRWENVVEVCCEDVGWGVNWDFGGFEVGYVVGGF